MTRTASVALRPITADDIPLLLAWRNSKSFRHLCTRRKTVVSEAEFSKELQEDFRFDRCEQAIIVVDDMPAGTVYAYRYSVTGKHVYVSIFLSEEFRGHALGAYALAKFVANIFGRFEMHKIYFEVYSHNKPVVRLLSRLGLAIEGELKGHCLDNDSRHNLLIFALYQDLATELCSRFNYDTHAGRNVIESVSA